MTESACCPINGCFLTTKMNRKHGTGSFYRRRRLILSLVLGAVPESGEQAVIRADLLLKIGRIGNVWILELMSRNSFRAQKMTIMG